jgi:hypothetical protein
MPPNSMTSLALDKAVNLPTGSDQNGQYELSQHEDSPEYGDDDSPTNELAEEDTPRPQPLQKRRRVTRACDECRRKKIKCDGQQPCTHCTVYSYGKIPNSESDPRKLTQSVDWYFEP